MSLTTFAKGAYATARQNTLLRRIVARPAVRRVAVAVRDGLKAALRSYRTGGFAEPRVITAPVAEAIVSSPAPVFAGPAEPVLSPYEQWFANRISSRRREYPYRPEPGLLSFFSPVWNTPPRYMRPLYESLDRQVGQVPFEWLILDNGTENRDTLQLLDELAEVPWIRVVRVFPNIGIGRAMRKGLEECRGRYMLPVDSDDLLLPDAAQIVTSAIQRSGYPAFLYSDEDHVAGDRLLAPYHKPGWDPVLIVNSAFTAHLEAIHRETALDLGVYPGPSVDGSTDWDTTLRFANAGHKPVHIPEMLYHWREHAGSTAADISCKSYIFDSQRAVLTRWLSKQPTAEHFELQLSPLFPGTPDWWIRRKPVAPVPVAAVLLETGAAVSPDSDSPTTSKLVTEFCKATDYPSLSAASGSTGWSLADLGRAIQKLDSRVRHVAIASATVKPTRPDWVWEAIGLMELFPEVVQVGGRVHNADGYVVEAGRVFGYGDDVLGCPDRGRPLHDCGYYAQMFKPRCTDGVASRFCVFERHFLETLTTHPRAAERSVLLLGHWAAAAARRTGRRVAWTPFINGCDVGIWQELASPEEIRQFAAQAADLVTGSPNYPGVFGLTPETAYTPVPSWVRSGQISRLGLSYPESTNPSLVARRFAA